MGGAFEDLASKLDLVIENQTAIPNRRSFETIATDRVWSPDEVARRLKVKRATVPTWTHRGQIETANRETITHP